MKSILNKKTVLIISLILILTLIISTSYAFFISSDSQTNVASTSCFELSFSASNTISLEHSYPISEAEASNLTPYTFTIKNICKEASSYDVTIEDLNTSDMDLSAIRYKLDNENSTILGSVTPNQTKVLTTSKSSRTIASGMLLYNEEITYNIKLWIDENANINQAAGRSFESKVIVVSSMDNDPYYTVTVNPNNGDSSYTRKIVKGRNLGNITEPTKVGYTFAGWYKDSQLTQSIDGSSSITKDESIYAKYTPNQYTVTLNNQSATISGTTSVNATYDSTMPSITIPSKTEYTFMGYYDQTQGNGTKYYNSNGTSNHIYDKDSTTTLYAYWQINPYYIIKNGVIQNNNWVSNAAATTGHNNSGSPTITQYSGYIKYAAESGGSWVISTNYYINLSKYTRLNVKAKNKLSVVITLDKSSVEHFSNCYASYSPNANTTTSFDISSLNSNAVLSIDTWNNGYAEIVDIWFS